MVFQYGATVVVNSAFKLAGKEYLIRSEQHNAETDPAQSFYYLEEVVRYVRRNHGYYECERMQVR